MSQEDEKSQINAEHSGLAASYDKYGRRLFLALNDLRAQRHLFDVTIAVGEQRIDAHKLVLSACLPYFRDIFTTRDMTESQERTLTLDDLDEQAVQPIIDWAYTGQLSVNDSNVEALLAAPTVLQITEIQSECCDYLKQKLNVANCLGVREIADKYSCGDLAKYATEYILDEFEEVIKDEEFLELTVDRLIEIISDDELRITSEEKVYEAVMRWVNHVNSEDADRTIHLSNLLHHVRFTLMDLIYLVKVVSENCLIKANKDCLECVNKAKDSIILRCNNDNKEYVHEPRVRQRKNTIELKKYNTIDSEILFVLGNHKVADEIETVFEMYDPKTNTWNKKTALEGCLQGSSLVSMKDKLFVLGGYNCVTDEEVLYRWQHDSTDAMKYYDLHTDEWIQNSTPLNSRRHDFGAIALNGLLYVIGGKSSTSSSTCKIGGPGDVLDLVEKYDHVNLRWSKCAPLKSKRCDPIVVSVDGYIYAIGGQGIHTVERYDTQLDQWEQVTTLMTKRTNFACSSYDGYIYVVGGKDEGVSATATGERYHPGTNSWEPIVPMSQRRFDHGLSELNGLIYAVGGKNENKLPLRTVEAYDPAKKSWSMRASMPCECSGVRIASLKRMPNKKV